MILLRRSTPTQPPPPVSGRGTKIRLYAGSTGAVLLVQLDRVTLPFAARFYFKPFQTVAHFMALAVVCKFYHMSSDISVITI